MRLKTSILAAVIAISASAGSAYGAETPPSAAASPQANQDSSAQAANKIEVAIWKLGVLSPDSKLSVQTLDRQLLVTVYGGEHEKAPAWLLEINAVLITKCVFDNIQEAARTKVGFGTLNPGRPRAGYLTHRPEGEQLYTMSLVAAGWKQSDMLALFNRYLGTWSERE